MIVSWMLYSLLVALLLAVGARPLERALRLGGRPGRWAWVAAVGGAVLVPAVGLALAGRAPEATLGGLGPVTPVAGPVSAALGGVTHGLEAAATPVLRQLEAPLLRLWALVSFALLVLFGVSALRLRRFRRRWPERFLDGDTVLVSREVGPAVLGLWRPRIVVPEWVVERGPEARSLILAHEREHCRARDPLLVFAVALPVALMPWNVPLWWCLVRLRLAVELDCDERVLRTATPGIRRRYGRLLVEVGRRPAGPVRAWAAFSERRSPLERRVRAITDRRPRNSLPRAASLGLLGLLAMIAACIVPSPDAPESALEPDASEPSATETPGEAEGRTSAGPVFTPYTEPPEIRNREEVQRALVREYPPLLRDAGIGGAVDLWLRVEETGRVRTARVHRSSGHERLDAAAMRVASVMRFSPAWNRDEIVPVWISMPIRFDVETPGRTAEEIPIPPEPDELPDIRIPPTAEELREEGVAPPPRVEPSPENGPSFTPYTVPPQVQNRGEVQRALIEEYPPLLRDAGIGGTVNVWFLIDEEGRTLDTRVHTASGHPALDEGALRVARTIEFSPAMNRDRVVPVWISLPIKFEVR